MIFPEITIQDVFNRIPEEGLEANAETTWNASMWYQGNFDIIKKKVGVGTPDGIIRFYSEDRKKFVWLLVEYKRDSKEGRLRNSLIQLLMYLGNFFYDTNLLGLDNFAGVISASSDHFVLIPAKNIFGIMEKFEYIWWKHYRVAPCDAYKVFEIKTFFNNCKDELLKDCTIYLRGRENERLDRIIKSIYEEWNLL